MRNEIDLWVWSLGEDNSSFSDSRAVLSSEENARAERFVYARDAARFIGRRLHMRHILAQYLACEPGAVAFAAGAHGKPFLDPAHGSDLQFNLSHSENVAVLAVAHGLELGVDVECLRPMSEDGAQHFFSRAEHAALAALPPEWVTRGFFECWTGKEAFVKAHGAGLSIPLDRFEVTLGPGVPSAILRIDKALAEDVNAWRLWRFEPAPGFLGAVAARTGDQAWNIKVCTSG